MSEPNTVPPGCKVCGIPAIYSYYGTRACQSCKMFFKRNAENRKKIPKCSFNNQCEVNINSRHICSACRLAKCFKTGMCIERLRPSQTQRKRKINRSATSTCNTSRQNEPAQQLTTLNLLERDHSLLSIDQWTHLSNLIHSYDEHNALPIAKDFMKELDGLHPKLRFKISSNKIVEIVTVFYQTAEPFIQSNHDFASLSSRDRSIVLHGAVDNVSCLGGGFLIRQSELITNPAFRTGLENTFGTTPYELTLIAISLLDQDINIAKLTLSLFAFCTSSCTLFDVDTSHRYLTDNRILLRIQNMYAELIWKYLLYRYTFAQAVVCYSRLIKCIIAALSVRTHLQTVKNHTDVVDLLIQKIEHQQINK